MKLERCMKCMNETAGNPCPHCGYSPSAVLANDQALRPGTILNGRYLVGCTLGQGGFGITYVGLDLAFERKIAIKEYFPAGQVLRSSADGTSLQWFHTQASEELHREGVESILKEAQKMSAVDHISEVVRVRDVFQGNETAYIVMDYVEGVTLLDRLRKSGPLSWKQAEEIFYPAIRAMSEVHKASLVHRDISPDNLMLMKDGGIRILDLGAAKDLKRNSGDSSVLVAKNGFSPLEQYGERGKSGPWSDVYAMAATIYYALTKVLTPEPFSRLEKDIIDWKHPGLAHVPHRAVRALQHALAVRVPDRTQSMDSFLKELQGEPVPQQLKKPVPEPGQESKAVRPEAPEPLQPAPAVKKKKHRGGIVFLILLLLLGAAAGAVALGYISIPEDFSVSIPVSSVSPAEEVSHSWQAADCETPKTCSGCGQTRGEALGHSWQAADCRTPKTCRTCGKTEGEPLAHNWQSADCSKAAFCMLCGVTEGEPLGHKWVSADCLNPAVCSTCGEQRGKALGHENGGATCEKQDLCTRCSTVLGPALGHNWQAADCIRAETCSRCGDTQGLALGHTGSGASCEKKDICTRCSAVLGEASGHSWQAASCTVPKTCSRCSKSSGSALGHSWSPATCFQPRTCSRCRATDGTAAAHIWDLDAAAKKRTCRVCRSSSAAVRAGDRIFFGSYEQDNNLNNGTETIEWQVLEIKNGRALLISRCVLYAAAFNSNNWGTANAWETSSIRSWLNGWYFYSQVFNWNEQQLIQKTSVDNKDGSSTQDSVFLLSLDEYKSHDVPAAELTAYAKAAHDQTAVRGSALADKTWWWLRTPGRDSSRTVYVLDGLSIDRGTESTTASGYIRPALWISLS